MDFSALNSACASAFGQAATLRRAGQDDVAVTVVVTDREPEPSSPGLLCDLFIADAVTITRGDKIIIGSTEYTVAKPPTVDAAGAIHCEAKR